MNNLLERHTVRVQGKEVYVSVQDFDGLTLREIVLNLIEKHSELEDNLKDGEFIKMRECSSWGDSDEYYFQVYRLETDEEYDKRVDKLKADQAKKEASELEMLQKLAKKYPDVKFESK